MDRLNNLKIRRKLVAMAFFIVVLMIGAMIFVVQSSLATVRQAFRDESNATLLQMGENIAQTLDAGINSSYQLSSPAFMQALIDRNIKVRGAKSAIVEFNVYAPDPKAKSGYRLIASNVDDEKGKEADPEDITAIKEDKTVVLSGTEDGIPILDITAPLHADGKPIAAAGIKLSLVASQAKEAQLVGQTADQVIQTAGIAGLLAVLVAMGLGMAISLNITRPLEQAVSMIQDMGRGRLDRRLRIQRSDEIGIMARAMDQFADDLSGLLGNVNRLSEAAVEGQLGARADASKYQGDFRKIVQGMNDTLDAVVGPLQVAAEYVAQIGKGQVPNPITDEYRGDFNEIKNNLNACIEGLGGLVESNAVLQHMAVNDYTLRVEGSYQGVYAQVADAVNAILARLLNLQKTMVNIASGDLTALQDFKQLGNGTGRRSENDKMAPAVIAMMEAIKNMVEESVALTGAAKAGKLATRADVSQFKGSFRDVLQGVNETLDAVIGPLNVAAEYVDRISQGEIPAPITDKYHGDFDELKNNLNNMIAYLNEMTRAATEIARGNLDVAVQPVSERDVLGQAFAQMTASLQSVVGDIVDLSQKLAAGDLTATPTGTYAGEFVKIKDGLMVAVSGLNNTLHQTNLAVTQVAQSVAQMQSVSQDLATGAQEQSSAVEEVSSNLEHTDGQVKNSAESANIANQLVVKTAALADTGKTKMKTLTGAMGAIAASSHEIAKIIKVIDDIAFQTNLLALNAAVEAARAGQAGRGFAVVAQEVRNLAERSAKAAKSTAELIQGSGQRVEEGVKITNETDAALGDIVQNVGTVKDLVGEIAATSEEESRSLAQISKAMGQVNSGAQSASAQSEQLASTAEELGGLAERLRSEVARFQLREVQAAKAVDSNTGHLFGLTAFEHGLPEGMPPELAETLRQLLKSKLEAEPRLALGSQEDPAPSGDGHGTSSLDRDSRGYDQF